METTVLVIFYAVILCNNFEIIYNDIQKLTKNSDSFTARRGTKLLTFIFGQKVVFVAVAAGKVKLLARVLFLVVVPSN